jgi:hypothetical protein
MHARHCDPRQLKPARKPRRGYRALSHGYLDYHNRSGGGPRSTHRAHASVAQVLACVPLRAEGIHIGGTRPRPCISQTFEIRPGMCNSAASRQRPSEADPSRYLNDEHAGMRACLQWLARSWAAGATRESELRRVKVRVHEPGQNELARAPVGYQSIRCVCARAACLVCAVSIYSRNGEPPWAHAGAAMHVKCLGVSQMLARHPKPDFSI